MVRLHLEVELKNHDVHVCHCSMCRRQTSGVIMRRIDVVQGSLKFIQQEESEYFELFRMGRKRLLQRLWNYNFLENWKDQVLPQH